MAEGKKGFKLFLKDGQFSKTAFILVITWFIVLVRYIVSGFTILGTELQFPDAGLTIGILAAASALYFGNHNITKFKAGAGQTHDSK